MENSEFKYELMVIFSLDKGLASAKKELESVKKQLSKHGEIFFEDIWGERDLGYTIKKQNKGFYAVFDFSFDPAEIKELETGMRLSPEVIRHLLVKIPFKYEPKTFVEMSKEKEALKAAKEESLLNK
jgi:small subunit ribosomal protein S6